MLMYTYSHIRTHMYILIHTCSYTRAHIHVYSYSHILVHTYIHTYMRTYLQDKSNLHDNTPVYQNDNERFFFRNKGFWYIGDLAPWPPVTYFRCVDGDECTLGTNIHTYINMHTHTYKHTYIC